ncbi:MAG: hypothetical protein E6Q97_08515 [Desulfurellales bacterium]|nr:MAG: hypothetical protein E6Q97_08515 [Desulfurellales bacterium]
MSDISVVQFDPTVEDLHKMVDATKDITATDLEDKAQLKIVTQNRIALKNARVKIEKRGKELRDDAIQFQRDVIAKERELVAIIATEEDRLAAIEKQAKHIALMKERSLVLPARRERLAKIGDDHEVMSDEFINVMDPIEFDNYVAERTAAKAEADRQKAEAERLAAEREAERAENERRAREREEQARIDERRRIEEETARKEREQAERAERERIAAEQRERDERARLEQQERYQTFRASHGWTPETKADFKEEKVGGEIVLYKKLGTFKLN